MQNIPFPRHGSVRITRRTALESTQTMYLRLALRRLKRTPAFTAGAIALLTLGTGATLVVFTILNALVLKTLPVRDPERLVAIEVQNSRGEPAALPQPFFDALSLGQESLDHVTGVLGGSVVSAEAAGSVHQAVVDGVTADYFSLLAVPIVAGRPLGSADYRAGTSDANTLAVLSDGYATRMFGSPVNALGRPIVLGETIVTVVGVSADAFAGIQVGVRTDVVVPASGRRAHYRTAAELGSGPIRFRTRHRWPVHCGGARRVVCNLAIRACLLRFCQPPFHGD